MESRSRGVLDTPHARGTTALGDEPGHDGNTLASSLRECSQLLLPGGRLALLLALLLLGAMAAVGASGESADHAMMSGNVTGDAADRGAFQAAFGVGRRDRSRLPAVG